MRKKNENKNDIIWLRLYSAAITVLLCFMIILYGSDSDILSGSDDTTKSYTQFESPGQTYSNGDSPKSKKKLKKQFEELYQSLVKKQNNQFLVEQNGQSIRIRISNNNIFEDNTTTLRKGAISILNTILVEMKQNKTAIGKVVVSAHTMQKDPTIPNEAIGDRTLTAERAAKISAYIQQKEIVEPNQLLSVGCGQFFPVTTIDSQREQNERLEILIEQ